MFPLLKFKIEGSSMCPSFKPGDTVLVNKFSYLLSRPRMGDVIVLKRKKFIMKRIIKIDKNEFFVEGDNKERSTDSRSFGWVNKKEIIGKVFLKI